MVIKWTSADPVIARVIRNIRVIAADYIADLPEWIAEAVMKTKNYNTVELREYCLKIRFHMADIPCKEETIAAVVLNGERLLPSNSEGPMTAYGGSSENSPAFQSIIKLPNGISKIEESDVNNYPYYLSTIGTLKETPVNLNATYRVRYNKLELSVESGNVKVYFWSVPVGDDGMILIPDHEDLHTAIYWYCRMMMIGAGFQDPVFKYDFCQNEWNTYASRAIADITRVSPDEKMRSIANNVSLIPNSNFWGDFGTLHNHPKIDI